MNNTDRAIMKMLRDMSGQAQKQRVYLVNGAPGSGKTSFVKSKVRPDDLVLDLDYITAALALDDSLYGDRKPQLDVALAVRDTILGKVERREGHWSKAYIITTERDSQKVKQLAERLNAEIVKMDASESQCIERIRNDTRRSAVADRHIELVNEWFQLPK